MTDNNSCNGGKAAQFSGILHEKAAQREKHFLEDLSGGLIKYYSLYTHKDLIKSRLSDLITNGKYDEALDFLKAMEQRYTDDLFYAEEMLKIYRIQKNYERALEMCEKALAIIPYDSDIGNWHRIAETKMEMLEESGQTEKAQSFFDSVINNENIPKKEKECFAQYRFRYLKEQNRKKEAISFLERQDIREYLKKYKIWYLTECNRYNEALVELDKAIVSGSYNNDEYCDSLTEAYNKKMDILCEMGRFTEAMGMVHIIAHREAETSFISSRKTSISNMHLHLESTLRLKKALAFCCRPENREIFAVSRIHILEELKRYDEALDICNEYLKNQDNSQGRHCGGTDDMREEVEFLKISILEELGRKEEMIACMKEFMEKTRNNRHKANLMLDLAYIYLETGMSDDAAKLLPELEKGNFHPLLYEKLAAAATAIRVAMLARDGREEQAMNIVAESCLKEKRFTNYAMIYEALNRSGLLNKMIESAAPSHTEMPDFLLQMAKDLDYNDRTAKAIDLLNRTLAKWPGNRNAIELKEKIEQNKI
ncbi:MAG: hypothetical protein K5838_04315 [Elusimicrobiales bacterium]|nr:hypothetical protein [Elusimicrobiales bacterium]